jgi:hypothetical protein
VQVHKAHKGHNANAFLRDLCEFFVFFVTCIS